MPVLHCYVDDNTMKRLTVASKVLGRDITELAEAAIAEGTIQSVPCINGRPIDKQFAAHWDAA